MFKTNIKTVISFFIISLFTVNHKALAKEFLFVGQDYPPFNYLDGKDIKGGTVDVLKIVCSRLKHRCGFRVGVPLARALDMAKLEIPRKLTKTDRSQALEILGLSSSYKNVADPYPLGGYSGVQINYTMEYIPISELNQLGNKTSVQSDFSYATVTLGKGFYQSVDIFIQMTPFEQQEDFNKYAGQLRWGFYDAKNSPLQISLSLFANSCNFQNLISTTTQGYDLIADYQIDNTSIYLGWGLIRVFGTFAGGAIGFGFRF